MCGQSGHTHSLINLQALYGPTPSAALAFSRLEWRFYGSNECAPHCVGKKPAAYCQPAPFPPFPNALLTRAITESVSSWPEGCVRPCPTTAECEHPPCKVGRSHSLCSIDGSSLPGTRIKICPSPCLFARAPTLNKGHPPWNSASSFFFSPSTENLV